MYFPGVWNTDTGIDIHWLVALELQSNWRSQGWSSHFLLHICRSIKGLTTEGQLWGNKRKEDSYEQLEKMQSRLPWLPNASKFWFTSLRKLLSSLKKLEKFKTQKSHKDQCKKVLCWFTKGLKGTRKVSTHNPNLRRNNRTKITEI